MIRRLLGKPGYPGSHHEAPAGAAPGYRVAGDQRAGDHGSGDHRGGDHGGGDPEEVYRRAAEFLRLYHHEHPDVGPLGRRLTAVWEEVAGTGTYRHTPDELAFGARVAWRNSNRCIGRLYWRSLQVRDLRQVTEAEAVAEECADHLRIATNDGRIRPLISVFAPDAPGRPGPRIRSDQLIRYAGHRAADGSVIGDPRTAELTELALRLGWEPGEKTPFDVLPLVVEAAGGKPELFPLPPDAVLEVPLDHPDRPWSSQWGLRWYAVPAVSDMCLEIGGVRYPAAPFNGWYMGTEIGARNLADTDRYDLLPRVARSLELDTASDRSLWKDRALVELNRAVLHSFDRAGVTITDHHAESRRFLQHVAREGHRGREVSADWSWIVPPMSGAATPVFHRTYDTTERSPAFVRHDGKEAGTRSSTPPAKTSYSGSDSRWT